MRRRAALWIHASAIIILLVVLVLVPLDWRGDPLTFLGVAWGTALACGATSLRFLRPILVAAHRPEAAAALLASATLATTAPILLVLATPTVAIALTPAYLPATLGGVAGIAVALPTLARAWRRVEVDEWRPLAIASIVLGAAMAPGGDLWFPLIGVVAVQAWAFFLCLELAWERDALVDLAGA